METQLGVRCSVSLRGLCGTVFVASQGVLREISDPVERFLSVKNDGFFVKQLGIIWDNMEKKLL